MSKDTIFDCARKAAQAEQKILELLESSLRDDLAEARSNVDLPKPAQPRQGENLRGS